jgi:hypothetical protein
MTWTIILPFATPSLNEIQGQHWSFAKRQKEAIAWSLRSALNLQAKIPVATGKRRVSIERTGRGRLDPDNLMGGFKWLIDAIKAERLIVDDDDDHLELIALPQVVSRKIYPSTRVAIEDIE